MRACAGRDLTDEANFEAANGTFAYTWQIDRGKPVPILKIPTPLRSYTDGLVEVEVNGRSVRDVMEDLVKQYPSLRPHLYDGDGKLRPFVNLFVGEHNIRDLDGLATALNAESRVLLVPSIAGG
jgi:molybdopterin converting factor small subunit